MVLVGQGLLAAAWWWLSPGGFGPGHPRFWTNRVAAPAVLAAAVLTLAALRRDARGPLRLMLPAWASAWAALAIASRVVFPITMAGTWRIPAGFAAAMALAATRPWRPWPAGLRWPVGLSATVAGSALAAVALLMAMHPPAAATHPLDPPVLSPGVEASDRDRIASGIVRLDPGSMVQASDGSLMARANGLTISIQPLLTFLSRSADGCPVVLVSAAERSGPEPRFRGGWRAGDGSWVLSYDFPGQGPATLRAWTEGDGDGDGIGAIVLDAATRLGRPVDSHLNAYCDVEIRGHRRLSLAFSPCPGRSIEVRPVDYPFGWPSRFAFVSADRTFRVVEASSGEKGPFRTLAQGRLEPDRSLTIALHDDGRPVAWLALDDFSAQADTTLSPTAGWGVPVNAIEFSLADDAPGAIASIFITLAGTSVGRGWDCVEHKAGTYRNRLRLMPATTTPHPD